MKFLRELTQVCQPTWTFTWLTAYSHPSYWELWLFSITNLYTVWIQAWQATKFLDLWGAGGFILCHIQLSQLSGTGPASSWKESPGYRSSGHLNSPFYKPGYHLFVLYRWDKIPISVVWRPCLSGLHSLSHWSSYGSGLSNCCSPVKWCGNKDIWGIGIPFLNWFEQFFHAGVDEWCSQKCSWTQSNQQPYNVRVLMPDSPAVSPAIQVGELLVINR